METLRPPVITILGHVDHGKTSLLDYIRKARVAEREHGGITQHIGAYQAKLGESGESKVESKDSLLTPHSSLITFIDTPGHAAFEKMRSRGAKVADIAVLVVAIDDGIMPQTIEAIKYIKAAKAPMIVAVNKMDLPGINQTAQMEKLKKQLSDHEVLIEEYGGDVPIVPLSAKTGDGVDKLMEIILLVAELNEFKGDAGKKAEAVVIEASLDKTKGPIATLLIRDGTLKKGDQINLDGVISKIRGMIDYAGKQLDSAGPSTPVVVLGLEKVPPVGAETGEEARVEKEKETKSLIERLKQKDVNVLNVIIKADKQGSLEAIEEALEKFNKDGEHLKIIQSGTGDLGEADIELASTTKSIAIGFNVKVTPVASKMAETEHVLIRTYNIIYELLDEMSDVVEGMLVGELTEEVFGTAQILAEFQYGKADRIAGCRVLEGSISKGPKVRIVREDQVIGEGKIRSLKKLKEEVNKVAKGDECGMLFDPPIDFQPGDLIQSYRTF